MQPAMRGYQEFRFAGGSPHIGRSMMLKKKEVEAICIATAMAVSDNTSTRSTSGYSIGPKLSDTHAAIAQNRPANPARPRTSARSKPRSSEKLAKYRDVAIRLREEAVSRRKAPRDHTEADALQSDQNCDRGDQERVDVDDDAMNSQRGLKMSKKRR